MVLITGAHRYGNQSTSDRVLSNLGLEEPMRKLITKFVTAKDGVTLIEYGLIAALVAIALVVALQGLATLPQA